MKRGDVVALAQGALVGALVAGVAVLTGRRHRGRPGSRLTSVSLPSAFVFPNPAPVTTPDSSAAPELPITLEADGLGISFFGDEGENVVRGLETLLGPPDEDERWTCPDPAGDVRFVRWGGPRCLRDRRRLCRLGRRDVLPGGGRPAARLDDHGDLRIGIELEHFEAHLGDRFAFTKRPRAPPRARANSTSTGQPASTASSRTGKVRRSSSRSRPGRPASTTLPDGGPRRGILRAQCCLDPVPALRAARRDRVQIRRAGRDGLPKDPDALSDAEWVAYLFLRDNPKGAWRERWVHSAGCRRWFDITRDTLTNEFEGGR